MIRWSAYVVLGLATLVYLPYVAIHAMPLAGLGWTTAGTEVFLFVPMLGVLVFLLALPGVAFDRTRKASTQVVVVAGGLVLLAIPAVVVAGELRGLGFRFAAKRAAPLVAAIRAYERDHGSPPERLEQLCPRYLPALPTRLPEFELVTGARAHDEYRGNSWALVALVSTGFLNWDQFMYLPNQDDPHEGYGGWVERIGEWGYVHE